MVKFIMRRLLWLIPVSMGVAVVIFSIMYFVPGDPVQIILGNDATPEVIAQLRNDLGLDDPYIIRLGRFLKDVFLRFNFGESYITHVSITKEMISRLPRTILIGFVSMMLTLVIGIPLGITAALQRNRIGDRISMIIAMFGVSMPGFWLALMLVVVFSVNLSWLPPYGIGGIEYYIMPCMANAVAGIAGMARQARSSMLEVIRSDYVVTARAKGLSNRSVILKHALPNALIPITAVAGSQLARIFGGSVVIENVFSIPGVGNYMVTAINNRDYPIVMSCVIFLAIIFSFVMLLVDIAFAYIDPRIKAQYMGEKNTNRRRRKQNV
ncbi:MAG: ABC transporter permease [Clostridiales bacterium]|jgi:peptide/nickel transport system permease protein|nr:ABC transporter permease [Clostridiales bacterium]